MSRFTRPPFFVLGCVRSGTTMLRELLARHPALVCPEETHLFRWPYPFGTPDYRRVSLSNRTLKRHREIDGIDEDEFAQMLDESLNRRELIECYMETYGARRKPRATRWFDKSPQNVYGLHLIRGLFPDARFVHIVRHPLEVVSSLKVGKVMTVPDTVGAANYWLEAVAAISGFAEANGSTVWQARYEDFTNEPQRHLEDLFAFLGEHFDPSIIGDLALSPTTHRGESVLTRAEIAKTWRICGAFATELGYRPWPETAAGRESTDPDGAGKKPPMDDAAAKTGGAPCPGPAPASAGTSVAGFAGR